MQLQVELPAVELVKGGQGLHVVAPSVTTYLPATQSVHSEASAVHTERQTGRRCDFEIQKHT